MSTLHVPDHLLQKAGISEQQALVELACRLFDTGKLDIHRASELAGMSKADFEDLLLDEKIPIYRYTEDDFTADLNTLRRNGT